MKKDFKLVLLGTDKNAYGMSKSLHEAYGEKALALGKMALRATKHSRIVEVRTDENFDQQAVFLKTMVAVGEELSSKYKKLLLIACGDNYIELIIKNKKALQKYFVVPYIDEDLHKQLEDKDSFYEMCEKYNLDYPTTYVCTYETRDKIEFSFSFPVAVKPADSIRYLSAKFEGRKKAYMASSREELEEIVRRIYGSSYRGNIIIQDFIPGDDSASWVLNTYSDASGKVKMMCLGDVILEHYHPAEIGNYAAMISTSNQEMYQQFKEFLEKINYVGYAHFDFKFDYRDNKYKLFEMNLRQGRGSYYITGAGYNLVRFLVDEYVYGKDLDIVYTDNEWLWLDIPKDVLVKYANKAYLEKIKELIRKKKYGYTLYYLNDFSFLRYFITYRVYMISRKMFACYFNKRGL